MERFRRRDPEVSIPLCRSRNRAFNGGRSIASIAHGQRSPIVDGTFARIVAGLYRDRIAACVADSEFVMRGRTR